MTNKIDKVIMTEVDLTVVLLLFALVFHCCCHKSPLTWWLQTALIWKVGSLRWVSRAVLLSRPKRRNHFFEFSSWQRLPVFLGQWPHIILKSDAIITFSHKDPCDYIGPTYVMQDSLPIIRSLITSVKSSLLLFKGHYSVCLSVDI